jgi:hypothetical protein
MKKHYRIVAVDGQTSDMKMDTHNTTPSGAAKKIFSLLKKHGKQSRQKKITVTVKDISRNSATKGKILSYTVEKIALKPKTTVERAGNKIVFTYKTVAKRVVS